MSPTFSQAVEKAYKERASALNCGALTMRSPLEAQRHEMMIKFKASIRYSSSLVPQGGSPKVRCMAVHPEVLGSTLAQGDHKLDKSRVRESAVSGSKV